LSSTAYLLLAHGSRDPRTTTAFDRLNHDCTAQLKRLHPEILLGTAYLELAELPIVEQLMLFAHQSIQRGCRRVRVLPLFLAPGVHVLNDLPQAIHQAQAKLSDRCQLELLPYLGASTNLLRILHDESRQLPAQQILLAHGSQQAAAQEFLASLVHNLHMTPAYWSANPYLPEQVHKLAASKTTEIGILPYFLFPGRISAAITVTINELQSLLPDIQFRFSQGDLEKSLLYQNPRLVDLMVQLLLATN
jgi:sirohydrochlorin cobaltochelatase